MKEENKYWAFASNTLFLAMVILPTVTLIQVYAYNPSVAWYFKWVLIILLSLTGSLTIEFLALITIKKEKAIREIQPVPRKR